MKASIPEPVLRADRALNELLEQVPFSRHLNPVNADDAREVFMSGADAPPFVYQTLDRADEILRRLDETEAPRTLPMGDLLGRCFDHVRLLVRALRDRTVADFDELANEAGWFPDSETLALRFPRGARDPQPADIDSERLILALRLALIERGMDDWRITRDPVMAARVLVDGAKRLLRVHPGAHFRERDLRRLVVHEIDVHVARAEAGRSQALACFATGLPGSMVTEEGLAMVAEERAGVASPGVLARQVEVVRAIDLGRRLSFRELYDDLASRVGPGLAWGICLRIKRGLADPGQPGVYAKDSVYLVGRQRVRAWLAAGGRLEHLFVGKVGLDDPVQDWLDSGWVQPGVVPRSWRTAAR